MLRNKGNALLVGMIVTASAVLQAQQWNLVWSDEFDEPGMPDPSRWGYELGDLQKNEELQYYTDRLENVRIEDGMLVIESRKESYAGRNYTSGSVQTRYTATWVYGRIEARAKLPTGKGMWPAFWMLGLNIGDVGWPTCGEIDIMENVGYDPNRIVGSIHTQAYNHVLETQKTASVLTAAPYDSFHVYAVEWFEDRIDFYLDARKYFSFRNNNQGVATWPFSNDFYIIINSAVGGTWGGQQGIDDSIFPQKYLIDYVRVYEWDDTEVSQNRTPPAEAGYSLRQNYPNPFNSDTEIVYQLPRDGSVRLDVFDLMGQLLRNLGTGFQPAGEYQVVWDGTTDEGLAVPTGLYFISLRDLSNDWIWNRKMLLVR